MYLQCIAFRTNLGLLEREIMPKNKHQNVQTGVLNQVKYAALLSGLKLHIQKGLEVKI